MAEIHERAAGVDHGPVTFDRIFNPRSLAIIGASGNAGKFAGKVTANALRSAEQSAHEVYLVNPNRATVLGHATYASIAELPHEVDHAYIAVPSSGVADQLRAADRAGIRVATVFSSGFAESGKGTAQIEMSDVLQPLRIRAIGPNCNGVINVFDSLAVTSSSVPYLDLVPGPVAVISHSGALGQVNGLQQACSRGIGVGFQMSCGNAADLTEVDLIEHAFADPRITVVVGILERISDGSRLLKIVHEAHSAGKFLVLVKLGQSTAGRAAILGHTGEALGNDGLARRLLQDAGVAVVEDIDQAMDCADLWAKNPGLVCNRVASVSLSGGNLAYFVDACAVRGITHPELPPQTQASLRRILPPLAVVSNPVDLSSSADVARGDRGNAIVASLLPPVLSILDASEQDAMVAILTLPPDSDLQALVSLDMGELVTPAIVIWAGDSREGKTSIKDMRQAGLTVFQNAVSCAQALQHFRTGGEAVRDASLTTDRVWPLDKTRRRLAEAGLRFPAGEVVDTEGEASSLAAQLGYPVAVKSAAAGLVHKATAGGVFLGLCSEAEVRGAYQRVVAAARLRGLGDPQRVLVERMAEGEHAIFMSVACDDSFGSVVLLGRTQDLDLNRRSVLVAAFDVLRQGELAQFIRAALGDAAEGAIGSIQEAIYSARDVLEGDNVELVEINPLFISGSTASAVDCVITGRHHA